MAGVPPSTGFTGAAVAQLRFARIGDAGAEVPVAVTSTGAAYDLRAIASDLDPAFWAADPVGRTREALASGELVPIDVTDSSRFGPPVARPAAIICVGLNYAAHAAESGSAPPEHPVIFFKHPNTLAGPNDAAILPRGSARMDWEVELAAVIGKRARYLTSPDEALTHVAGYAISNDLSERAFQLEVSGGQWSKGKCCETFNPMGPYVVPADEVPDPQRLGLRTWVNGELRQSSSTADMIFGVGHLVWELSQHLVLEPGDVINTGTPEGVALSGRFPYLEVGDHVRCEIDGLGAIDQVVTAAPADPGG